MKITILNLFDAGMLGVNQELTYVENPQERCLYLAGHWDLRTCFEVFFSNKYMRNFLADFVGMKISHILIQDDVELPNMLDKGPEYLNEINSLIAKNRAFIVYEVTTLTANKTLLRDVVAPIKLH